MKKVLILILSILIGCSQSVVNKKNRLSLLSPNVSTEMTTSPFWLKRLKTPDKIIMNAKQIKKMNYALDVKFGRQKLAEYPYIHDNDNIKDSILEMRKFINAKELYDEDGNIITDEEKNEIDYKIGLDEVDINQYKAFGVITKRTMQKYVPSDRVFVRNGSNKYFDRNILTSLNVNELAIILWRSTDERWYFIKTFYTTGWVKVEDIAITSRKTFRALEKEQEKSNKFAMIIKHKTSVYEKMNDFSYYALVETGNRFALGKKSNKTWTSILMPIRNYNGLLHFKEMYVKNTDLNIGYMPYTSKNSLQMAFNFINSPYGWGGNFDEQDCSGFIMQIYRAFGIFLPRNSYKQSEVGINLINANVTREEKIDNIIFDKTIPGATLLYMTGHIMLYVGEVNGEPYVINSIWSYVDAENEYFAAKVTINDLNLGNGSSRGDFLTRIRTIKNIKI
ncbi:MAG: SH3 domain-containing protein [Rickettsiales bacterium]|jgi:hypothetical protein|nr:SH3 domain-containing protein [Rickettsiales bacterium]